jgi:hypothetical protein
MPEDRAYCFNVNCPQGAHVQYSQRGLAVHLGRSPICCAHVSLENGCTTSSTVHGHLDRSSSTMAFATGLTLAHSTSTKRRRMLVNEAHSDGRVNPVPPDPTPQPQLDHLHHGDFAFHDNDDAADTPTMSSTTSERSMVKLMKILEDMAAPDYAVEVIIEWAQAALAALGT